DMTAKNMNGAKGSAYGTNLVTADSYGYRSVNGNSYGGGNMNYKSLIRSSAELMAGNNSGRSERVLSRYPAGYMRKGDRIYVCVMQYGRRLLEFSVSNVDCYTALMGEIRYAGRELDGLMKVFIRNHTRGWSEERPLKFYAGMPAPRRLSRNAGGEVRHPGEGKRMLAPWETH
ncbi:MAG: hypothetical protein K2J15_03390, partial [Muribaculaceae bacterium]|nr:hypothetical protein [Muribaculaceae bacterium]